MDRYSYPPRFLIVVDAVAVTAGLVATVAMEALWAVAGPEADAGAGDDVLLAEVESGKGYQRSPKPKMATSQRQQKL